MTSTVKKLKNSEVELIVDLNKEDLLAYTEEVEKNLAKEMKMEGFRPGKAPKEFVRKQIGEEKLREEALHFAVETSLARVLNKEKLEILDQLNFKIKENSSERFIYQVVLLVSPEVKLGDYKNLGVEKHPVAVATEEVEKVLKEIQRTRATLKEVDRPARLGDKVEVDFIIRDRDAIIEGGQSENHPVILGEGNFVPGFEAQIVEMKTGEKKSFSLKIPQDYYQKTIAGKELNFEVALKKVEDRSLPELDDNFAKTTGRFQNLAELKTNVKENLLLEKEEKEKDKARRVILEKVAAATPIEIPEVLINRQLDAMIQGLDNELHQRGMELGPYLAHLKKTQNDLKKDWKKQAEEQVKTILITKTIAKEEHLGVTEEEIGRELQAVLQQYVGDKEGAGPEALRNINPEELKARISAALLNEKVLQFLEQQNLKKKE